MVLHGGLAIAPSAEGNIVRDVEICQGEECAFVVTIAGYEWYVRHFASLNKLLWVIREENTVRSGNPCKC